MNDQYDGVYIFKDNKNAERRTVNYYHVTKTSNLKSIMKHGLIPQIGERSAELGESEGVFLFKSEHDMNTALSQWLGDWYNDKEDELGKTIPLHSLEIKLPTAHPIYDTGAGYEFVSYEPIPKEYITIHKKQ